MAVERERKFLVRGDAWRTAARSRLHLKQGYLVADRQHSVRVRVADERAWITIKGAARGAEREEFEYEIPLADARALLERLCERPLIEKTRHLVPHDGRTWEVDEFHGDNAGLVVAEIEFQKDDEPERLPDWVGDEVTSDPRYLNANLFRKPYRTWQGSPRER